MAFNIEEIAQKQNRLLANISEQNRKAYDMFYSPTPADVTLPQYDENGQLVNVSIPNRAKIKKQIWDDMETGMYKVFYVDAINGNDENDGTDASPFSTLKHAIVRVPRSGSGIIFIKNDLTHTSYDYIELEGRKIFLRAHPDTPDAVLNFITTSNSAAIFLTQNSFLEIGMHCSFANSAGNALSCIASRDNSQLSIIYNYQKTLQSGTKIYSEMTISDNCLAIWLRNSCIRCNHLNITAGTNAKLFSFGLSNSSLSFKTTTITLNGSAITGADVNSLSTGIIKDANGVPRNIVSNIIF